MLYIPCIYFLRHVCRTLLAEIHLYYITYVTNGTYIKKYIFKFPRINIHNKVPFDL